MRKGETAKHQAVFNAGPTVALVATIAACFALTGVFLFCDSSAGAATVPSDSWPMYQFGPDHNAVFDSPSWNVTWRADFGDQINGSLSIVGSTVFVESFDKHLYAMDATTGRLLWKAPLSNIAMNTPLVGGGLVYAGTGSNESYPEPSNPAVLYAGRPGGDDIDAFDRTSGAKVWSYNIVGEAMPTGVLTSGEGSRLVFATGDKHAYALAAATGSLLWKVGILGNDAMSSLAEDNGLIFGSTGYGLFWPVMLRAYENRDTAMMDNSGWSWALRPQDGQMAWVVPHGRGLGSPAAGDGIVFIESEQFSGWYGKPQFLVSEIDALDEMTGRLIWKYVSSPGSFSAKGSGLEDIGGVFWHHRFFDALPYARTFAAFDAKTGRLAWQIHTEEQVKMSPLIYGDKILFGDTNGLLYIANVRDGSIVRKVQFPGTFTCSSPVIVSNTLFVTNGNALYALKLDDLERGTFSAPKATPAGAK